MWTGIGVAGTAVMGILLFDESRDPFRIMCILVIVGAIAGLRLSSPT
ncbi:MAG: SMR family transporter [Nitrospirota bacterium]